MNRARRLLDGTPEGAAHGYLAYLDALAALMGRDAQNLPIHVSTLRRSYEAHRQSRRGCVVQRGRGPARDHRGPHGRGIYGLIDEAMLPVLGDQVPIDWAGDI